MLDNVHLLFDRHADDPLLVQMVERLERLAQASVAQVILVSRSTPQFAQLATAEPLRGLSRQDTDTLLRATSVHLPETLRAALYARTEGNAELLVLAIQALQGADEPATLINRLAKADNVEHYLLVEVDEGLSEEDRQVMTGVAALLGLPATRDAIEQTLERGSLKRTLTYLANRYLLATQQGVHDKEFLQHAVLRDFYYDLLSRRERSILHQRAAEYYSTVDRDPLRAAQQFCVPAQPKTPPCTPRLTSYGALARGQVARLELCLAELESTQLPPALAAQVKIAAVELHQYKRDPDAALAAGAGALSLLEMLGDDPKARHATAHVCWILRAGDCAHRPGAGCGLRAAGAGRCAGRRRPHARHAVDPARRGAWHAPRAGGGGRRAAAGAWPAPSWRQGAASLTRGSTWACCAACRATWRAAPSTSRLRLH